MQFSNTVRLAALLAMSVTGLAACASGSGTDGGPDTGPRTDGGRTDSGSADGGGGVDSGRTDGGAPCGSVVCTAFQYCDGGLCRDYPACRGDGTCDRPGDFCHSRRCVPGDADPDGDGSPASEDCDETNPERYPGRMEECNLIDDDCDMMVDDGDPATICESYPGGGICVMGSCGCPAGTYDLDRSVAGCECVAMPPIDQGLDCGSAIDLGNLDDSGQMLTVSGNVMPDDRETWYRFRGVDSADTACDNYHVRAQFTANPSDTFELTVFRGDCDTVGCADMGYVDYSWATDFPGAPGMPIGECPCTTAAATAMNVSVCDDDSADYFVRVRRRAGSALACDPYTIEFSNGIYDT